MGARPGMASAVFAGADEPSSIQARTFHEFYLLSPQTQTESTWMNSPSVLVSRLVRRDSPLICLLPERWTG